LARKKTLEGTGKGGDLSTANVSTRISCSAQQRQQEREEAVWRNASCEAPKRGNASNQLARTQKIRGLMHGESKKSLDEPNKDGGDDVLLQQPEKKTISRGRTKKVPSTPIGSGNLGKSKNVVRKREKRRLKWEKRTKRRASQARGL